MEWRWTLNRRWLDSLRMLMWSTDGVEWSLQQLKAVIAGWTDWQWILPQISAKALDPRTFLFRMH
uniref:Uncharacterized protein n=1 Tax=Anguilla anguilla TaxID=7936 RepID=A0A0E9W6K9_ANGAN